MGISEVRQSGNSLIISYYSGERKSKNLSNEQRLCGFGEDFIVILRRDYYYEIYDENVKLYKNIEKIKLGDFKKVSGNRIYFIKQRYGEFWEVSYDKNLEFLNEERVPESEKKTLEKNIKKKKQSPLVGLISILAIPVIIIGSFLKESGLAGIIVLLPIIILAIYKINKEKVFVFHIFNCLWLIFISEIAISIFKDEVVNSKDGKEIATIVILAILILPVMFMPSFIRFIIKKLKNKKK